MLLFFIVGGITGEVQGESGGEKLKWRYGYR